MRGVESRVVVLRPGGVVITRRVVGGASSSVGGARFRVGGALMEVGAAGAVLAALWIRWEAPVSSGRRSRGVGGTIPRVGGVTAMREARGRIWQCSSTTWETPVPGWEPSVRGQCASASEWEAQVSNWEAVAVAVGGTTRQCGSQGCGRKLGGCSCVHPCRTMLNCVQRIDRDLGFLYLRRSRLSCCLL